MSDWRAALSLAILIVVCVTYVLVIPAAVAL